MSKSNHKKIIDLFAPMGEMGAMIATKDWSATSIGAVEGWPQSLRTALSIALESRYPMCVWWGADFSLIYNDAWRPVLGQDKHPQALGSPGRDVFPEIWETLGAQMQTIADTGSAMYFDDLLLSYHRYGYLEEIYFTYSLSPIRGAQGRVVGIFTAVIETTERVINERRARTLRDLGKAADGKSDQDVCRITSGILSENRHDVPFVAIYFMSENGRKITNCASFGIEPGSLIQQEVFLDDKTRLSEIIRNVMDVKTSVEFSIESEDIVSCDPWGEPARTGVVVPCFVIGSSEPFGFIVFGINARHAFDLAYDDFCLRVSEKFSNAIANARLFEEQRKQAQILAELDKAKTLFFSNVSHEFRTPLTLMLGPIENALLSSSKVLEGEELDLVHRNGLRLLKLVNTLLDFSRIEAGRVQAFYEPIDLAQFTADLASVFRSAIEKAGLTFEVDCPPLGQPVFVDRNMWEKIVLNLISNAFKFTAEGKISVKLTQKMDMVELRVEDSGLGISSEDLPKVFERFHRVENVLGRSQEGSGIGLALVQELVRLHSGTLYAESSLGKGSVFIVSIPFGTKALLDGPKVSAGLLPQSPVMAPAFVKEAENWDSLTEGNLAQASSPVDDAKGQNKKVRILVADDNADMRAYLKRLISRYWAVETVSDGQVALASAIENLPDLILTDVMMPVLDGFQLVSELRKNQKTKDVPIILLSARAGEEAKLEGLATGADGYLVKPFSARELIGNIESRLQISSIQKEAKANLKSSYDALEIKVKERTKELADRLSEREVLLREIHHRVKNNLNVISGLLDLQKSHLSKDDAFEALRESQNRVQTISLVHEKLYQSSDLSRVDFKEYIEDLIPTLFRAYGSFDRVNSEIAINIPKVSIELAIPCSLIITELVSNVLKYAFKDGKVGTLQINMGLVGDGEIKLSICDNGIGVSKDLNLETPCTLGYKLIHILTRQLLGAIAIDRRSGLCISITFPCKCEHEDGQEAVCRPMAESRE